MPLNLYAGVERRRGRSWYASCKWTDVDLAEEAEMSMFKDPFNPEVKLGCACGRHRDQATHDADVGSRRLDTEALASRAVD